MPELVEPDTRFHASFLRAMAGFTAEGRGSVDDDSMIGRDLRTWAASWDEPGAFAAYVDELRAQALADTPRPAYMVPSTTLWWVEGEEWLGRIQLRQRLNERLLAGGGHIGYDVAPEHRRRGHATAMLRAMLAIARTRHGIVSALVTCDPDNVASRRVIEACGGVLEDERDGKLRFWVPTQA
ncbi:GNAT family N-acetyltransferase [Phycicoccus sp. M110.8]|uniref:GNAT family N-acetyltransferase n=1 Tax=Phycicoccus sp. M110.8 TaxID=3075433 RepID=UPI0028FDBA98|nr:GNAT family N-acetyltransferase [Phycicoccus sp. M110.8]MDU0313275.1 GNAT family N-acetyltransferase [Phycicoccus sp. M110.8]